MAIKKLLQVWGIYVVLSWVTSLWIFYGDIGIGSDLHRWLPVIINAEDFFVAQGQLDFLKKTAIIYEKDVFLLVFMLVYMLFVFRYGLKMTLSGFSKLENYKGNYLGLIAVVTFSFFLYVCFVGPSPESPMRGFYYNKLYKFSVYFGAFYYTIFLPALIPIAAVGIAGFLEPVKNMSKR